MACGEYGSTYGRPHYHAIIFNLPPLELRQIGTTKTGFPTFVSDLFAECWPFGFHTLNYVSFESCAYVARYVTKKFLVMESKFMKSLTRKLVRSIAESKSSPDGVPNLESAMTIS